MTEIEIAAGAVIAAQHAVTISKDRNWIEQKGAVIGSLYYVRTHTNGWLLNEAYEALEVAVRKLLEARDRQARMIES